MRLDKPIALHSFTGLALAAALALTVAGCSEEDTPLAPTDTGFSLSDYFTEQEAVVTSGGSDTQLRMVGVQFTARESSTLTPESISILDKFRTVFEKLPGAKYSIESHTDSQGAQDFNQTLSEQRADRVRDYFVTELGGPAGYISAAGYGEDRPIAPNSTAEGRAINNRIEIIVQHPTGDPVFTVTLVADHLKVYEDCDAMSGSASAAAGDFYINVELRSIVGGTSTLISRTGHRLVQLDDGESATLDIRTSGQFIASSDARLESVVNIFENDTNGHQFDRTNTWTLLYDQAAKCFKRVGNDACTGNGAGELAAVAMLVREVPGDPCRVDLGWRLRADGIGR